MRIIWAVAAALALACSGVSAAATEPVRTVVLTIHHSRFSATRLSATPEESVRFVVRNLDPIDHELIVGPMGVQQRHESGSEKSHPPRPGEVSVPLFSEASTTYAFAGPGMVWFGCHLPNHWDYGMQGTIRVG